MAGSTFYMDEAAGDFTYYCTRDDIEDVFGVENVKQWADLDADADATKISNRIDRAREWATSEINDKLRGGRYTIPIQNTNAEIPVTITNICAQMAGVWLYESRGIADYNPETGGAVHRLKWNKDQVLLVIAEIQASKRRLDAVSTCITYPKIVEKD